MTLLVRDNVVVSLGWGLAVAVHVGCDIQGRDVVIRDGFEPYSLPDARAGGVEDMGRTLRLLSLRDALVICRVEYKDLSLTVLALSHGNTTRWHLQVVDSIRDEMVRNIQSEARVAASIEANHGAVDKYGSLVVDGFKVEQDAAIFRPPWWNLEAGAKPHASNTRLHNTRDTALNAGWDQNLVSQRENGKIVVISRTMSRLIRPDPIQRLPGVATELWARILWPWLGADLVGPRRVKGRRPELVWY